MAIISTVRINAGITVSGVKRFSIGLMASAKPSLGKTKIEKRQKKAIQYEGFLPDECFIPLNFFNFALFSFFMDKYMFGPVF